MFERPSAASDATRCSDSVSSSSAGRRPLIRRSSICAFSAQSRAPSSSKIASACSRAARAGSPLLCLSPHHTEAEQRAAALERKRDAGELGEGALESGERPFEIAVTGGKQAAAAGGAGYRPGATELKSAGLVVLEVRACPLGFVAGDE